MMAMEASQGGRMEASKENNASIMLSFLPFLEQYFDYIILNFLISLKNYTEFIQSWLAVILLFVGLRKMLRYELIDSLSKPD